MPKRRRQPRRRSTGGRGAPGCLSVLFLVAVIAAVTAAAIFIFFKMKHIEVEGAGHYKDTDIIAASGAETGSNLVFINKRGMTIGITSALPYVDGVKITRRLPDTLIITVTETKAAAYFTGAGDFWLCNTEGKLLERVTEEPMGLIRVDGVQPVTPLEGSMAELGEEGELRLQTYADTLSALERAGLLRDVDEIDLSGLYDVSIRLDGRFDVDFGAPEDLDYKIEYLREIVQNKLGSNQKGSIDLSRLIEKGEARFLEEF